MLLKRTLAIELAVVSDLQVSGKEDSHKKEIKFICSFALFFILHTVAFQI